MFNKTYIKTDSGPRNVTINEHRAPTDQSVQLLKEMEEGTIT